jgi:hypothetical protein
MEGDGVLLVYTYGTLRAAYETSCVSVYGTLSLPRPNSDQSRSSRIRIRTAVFRSNFVPTEGPHCSCVDSYIRLCIVGDAEDIRRGENNYRNPPRITLHPTKFSESCPQNPAEVLP